MEAPGACQAARMSEYSYEGGHGRNTSRDGRTFLVNFKGMGDNFFFFLRNINLSTLFYF